MTYLRSTQPYEFPSPKRCRLGGSLDLEEEFPTSEAFETACRCHLTAQWDIPGVGEFFSPFTSFTASLRYAISVAALQGKRGHRDITITAVDTKRLADAQPIWNAYKVACHLGITGKKGADDFQDEYLVFDTLQGDHSNAVTSQYTTLKGHLDRLMPALRNVKDKSRKRKRFSDYLDDVPMEASLPTEYDGDTACELATIIAPKQVRCTVMTSLLLLQHRELANDPRLHSAICELVVDKVKVAEAGVLPHYPELMSIVVGEVRLRLRDFLSPQYVPSEGSATPETTDLCHCLAKLRRRLHTHQDYIVARRVDGLSTAGLMIQEFLKLGGFYDPKSKQCDPSDTTVQCRPANGSQHLLEVFAGLQQAVQEAVDDVECISPLLWLHNWLKDASDAAKAASQLEVSIFRGCYQMLSSILGI